MDLVHSLHPEMRRDTVFHRAFQHSDPGPSGTHWQCIDEPGLVEVASASSATEADGNGE